MEYIYLGKRVTVVRTTSGDVAQLSDGTWVNMGMLQSVPTEEIPEEIQATKTAIARVKAKTEANQNN